MVGVIQGKEGYLFLTNDANRVIDQHIGRVQLGAELDRIYLTHLERAVALLAASNGRYIHIVVPNKETVARDLLPDDIRYESEGLCPLRQYLHARPLAPAMTYFRPDALAGYLADRYYYRYDTHWTSRGAIHYLTSAFRSFDMSDCAALLETMDLAFRVDSSLGDLGRKLGFGPEGAELAAPSHPHSRFEFTNRVTNEGCIRHFRNDAALCEKRVLFIHDSTAQWLIFVIPELFSEVLFVHCADLDMQFLSRFRPNLMIFMQIERFFVRPPRNDVDYGEMIRNEEQRKGCAHSAVAWFRDCGLL